MTAENFLRVMQKAETKKLGDSVYRFLSYLCLRTNNVNCLTLRNDVIAKHLGVCERSVAGYISTLAGEDIIMVSYNRRRHTRTIRIVVEREDRYIEPAYDELSEAQRKFKDRYPNRAIDCEVPADVNLDCLLAEMELSQFLKETDNMSLKSCCIKHYKLIMKGHWRDSQHKVTKQRYLHGRKYTKEELDSLWQNIEDVEV